MPIQAAGREGEAFLLGSNVPTIGGRSKGFLYAKEWNCDCIQIYVTLSRKWNVPNLTQEEIAEFKSAWKESAVGPVVAHVPFLVNIASADSGLWLKSINRLVIEAIRCYELGIPFLVLHPGSHRNSTKTEGLNRAAEALNVVCQRIEKTPVKILLETAAGQGFMIGARFEEISYILEHVQWPEFLGVCLDSAHIFTAGYDIRGYLEYENTLKLFDKIIGLEKIQVIHLNDSKTGIGSGVDRHDCIGQGEIGIQFFHALMRDSRFTDTPKILEIPERDKKSKDNIALLRKLQTISNPFEKPKTSLDYWITEGVLQNALSN
jgi:deoxyribonuclease-4